MRHLPRAIASSLPHWIGSAPWHLLLLSLWCVSSIAHADFDTVIDSPPATFERFGQIDSNTQVNLLPGGVLPGYYNIGPTWEPGDNIEINLLGGTIAGDLQTSSRWVRTTNVSVNLDEGDVQGSVRATNGSLITLTNASVHRDLSLNEGSLAVISGGQIDGELYAYNGSGVQLSGGVISERSPYPRYFAGATVDSGSTFLMSGGVINGRLSGNNSYISVSGGRVEGDLSINGGGSLDWSAGSAGKLHLFGGSKATLIGGDFRLDGEPIADLSSSAQPVQVPAGSVLTGVLTDGTPIGLSDIGYLQDSLSGGTLSLGLAPIPAKDVDSYNSPGQAVPVGLRSGQSLVLRHDGVTPGNFTTHHGARVDILGGQVGFGFKAIGTDVTLTEGLIGEQAILLQGSTLNASGGEIGSNFEVGPGSRFELSGGSVDWQFVAHPDSEVHYSGGRFKGTLQTLPDSSFTLTGGEFKINGVPIESVTTVGSTAQIDLPHNAVLTGTLSEGTPFAFWNRQSFAEGTLTLEASTVPAAESSLIRVPNEPAPEGLRSGQTLLLAEGGELGDSFTAHPNSVVRMSGGRIGHGFLAAGGLVNATGGEIGSIDVLLGSVVNFGGAGSDRVGVYRGGVFNLSDGRVGWLRVNSGGHARVTGGVVDWGVEVGDQSSFRISGGEVDGDIRIGNSSLTLEGGLTRGEIAAYGSAQVNLRGGRLGDGLRIDQNSQVIISGADLRIDGFPVQTNDDSFFFTEQLDLPEGSVLSGVFSDGTPFAFSSSDGDIIPPGTLTVSTSRFRLSPLPVSFPFSPPAPPRGVQPGESLTITSDVNVGDNFTAGWDSNLVINGGVVGDNFEAVGAVISLEDGAIGEQADVFVGSELNVSGGTVGDELQVHSGGVVNVSGGLIQEVTVRNGGVLNVTGGIVDRHPGDEYVDGEIVLEAGAELSITGTEFFLNHEPVEGLSPGESILLEFEDDTPFFNLYPFLTATLLDGSPFAARLEGYPGDIPSNWQFPGDVTIRLTHAAIELSVPEPTSLLLLAPGLAALAWRRPREKHLC